MKNKKWLYILSPILLIVGSITMGATVEELGTLQIIAMILLMLGGASMGVTLQEDKFK